MTDRSERMAARRQTDGARDLRRHLKRLGVSVPTFCEQKGLDRIQVQRALNGEHWQRISVDFAWAIEKATDSLVQWHRWRSSTGRQLEAASSRTGTGG